jgi:hypothetical protein
VITWKSNGLSESDLRSTLRESFSVVSFLDEVSADEFVRVFVYFVMDRSPVKPRLKSFNTYRDSDEQEIKIEKLHPDWSVFSQGCTAERSVRKINTKIGPEE